MDFEKLNSRIKHSEKVEELILLSGKVFGNSSDDVKKAVETFITEAYKMGKQNMVKSFDE